jgi:hypothetical protein
MLSSGGGGSPPGWYPDPGGSPALRWWNGTAWTSELSAPAAPLSAPRAGPFSSGLGPDIAQAGERRKLPWAKVATWVLAAQPLVLGLGVLLVWHDAAHWISEIRATLNATPAGATLVLPAAPSAISTVFALLSVFYAFALAWNIVLIVFMYSAASHARDLGLPARLSPVWAVLGWIVPVVNLWFPYWVLRDCLPPRHAEHDDPALRFWLLFVFSFVLDVLVAIGRWVDPLLGALLLAAAAGYAVVEARAGSRALDRICESHEALTAALAQPRRIS